MAMSRVFNEDCMVVMSRYPDKYFDLAIVDPPYGIDINMNMGKRGSLNGVARKDNHERKKWDAAAPDEAYFT